MERPIHIMPSRGEGRSSDSRAKGGALKRRASMDWLECGKKKKSLFTRRELERKVNAKKRFKERHPEEEPRRERQKIWGCSKRNFIGGGKDFT